VQEEENPHYYLKKGILVKSPGCKFLQYVNGNDVSVMCLLARVFIVDVEESLMFVV
jgi:hypothetical protein